MQKNLDDEPSFTWQAFRLSLISTWLVWVPTHMYTCKTHASREAQRPLGAKFGQSLALINIRVSAYFFSIVQKHDVIISQIILTKVRAFLRYGKVAFLIGAPVVNQRDQ